MLTPPRNEGECLASRAGRPSPRTGTNLSDVILKKKFAKNFNAS
jgi:hypothetical protein